MALNNYSDLYKKLSSKISLLFCLFFVVLLNIMRFNQLQNSKIVEPLHEPEPLKFVYTAFFKTLEEQNLQMLILNPYFNKKYLTSVFEKALQSDVVFVNCTEESTIKLLSFLNSRFSTVIEETCDISTPEIEQFLNQNKLVVFLNPLHFLSHPSALKAAERLQLQPHINLTEIKNGHQRL